MTRYERGSQIRTNKKTASAVVGKVVHVMEYSTAPIGACRYSRIIGAVQTTSLAGSFDSKHFPKFI